MSNVQSPIRNVLHVAKYFPVIKLHEFCFPKVLQPRKLTVNSNFTHLVGIRLIHHITRPTLNLHASMRVVTCLLLVITLCPHPHPQAIYWGYSRSETLPQPVRSPRVINDPLNMWKARWADDTLDLLSRHPVCALLRGPLMTPDIPAQYLSCWCSHWSPTQYNVTWSWWNSAMFHFFAHFCH